MSEARQAEQPQREQPQQETNSFHLFCPFEREVVPIEKCRKCPPKRRELCPQMGGGG